MNKIRLTSVFLLLLLFTSCGNKLLTIKPDDSESLSLEKAKLNVFIENSGSMDGFVIPGSEFKSDLYSYVSAAASKVNSTNYYYINSDVIPIRTAGNAFFQNLSAGAFKNGGGNRRDSELVQMIGRALSMQNDSTITIFASDCILDPQPGNANDYFGLRQTDMRNVIQKYLNSHNDFGIIIYCLSSSFNGYLYPVGQSPMKCNTPRPYYVWVMGSSKLIGQLNKVVSSNLFRSGVKYEASFVNCKNLPFTASEPFNETTNKKLELKDSKKQFYLKVNFSPSLLSDDVIMDTKNYKQHHPAIKLISVEKINDKNYTHQLTVSYHSRTPDGFYLDLNKKPDWLDKMNDDTGNQIHTTCGIKYMINGVADAFSEVKPLQIDFEIK